LRTPFGGRGLGWYGHVLRFSLGLQKLVLLTSLDITNLITIFIESGKNSDLSVTFGIEFIALGF